jgi:xanthine dehydrogenase accessory factor
VLVEADGSKHMPLKFPNATEPVIPPGVGEIIVVWGPQGLGRPAREVCHRLALVMDCLGIDEDTPITREHVSQLLEEGYLKPLKEQYPDGKIEVYPKLFQ